MGGSKSKMVIMFVMLLIIFKSGWSEGCLDHERFALLRLKHHFDDTGRYLSDWVDGEGATDCCQWEMVECSNTTGRVIALDLIDTNGGEHSWCLNASFFTPFQQLESLSLHGSNIAGFVKNKGLERLSNLKRLDLSYNLFNNSILSSVAHLSSLTSLDLSKNRLEGSINVKEFDSFNNLEVLDMSGNEIDNLVVPQGYRGLRKLKSLDLSRVGIRVGSKLLQSMGSFPSLNTLDLSWNNFTKTVTTTQELHNFTSLEYLTLDSSSLHISLLQSIASLFPSLKSLSMLDCEVNGVLSGQGLERLTNLKILDLRGNLFNNSILSSLPRLSSLTSLDLSYNGLEGSINVKEFDSLSNLEELDMSGNDIDNLEVPQGYKGLRKLKTLYLLGVGIRDGSKLLKSMGSFPSLNTLDLSYNNFTDIVIATQELHNFTNLEYLTLDFSSLHISLLQSIASIFPSLKNLSMSVCDVNGVLRGQGFPHFKSLEHLDMDGAHIALNTSFLQIIGESMPSLKYLSLSNSNLGTNSSRILDRG